MKIFKYTIVAFILLTFTSVILSKDFRVYIVSVLSTENSFKVATLDLPELTLDIPEKTQQKFDLIYSKYTRDFYGKEFEAFVDFLNENNQWEKARITFNNTPYNILIKLHGKTPIDHKEGNYYSLGVKVIDGKQIKGVTRFNLIVHQRIKSKPEIIEKFSKSMQLLSTEGILMKVNINNSSKLYYFEYRTNAEYFSNIQKSNLIALKYKGDHSLVYTGGDLTKWDKKLKKAINKLDVVDSTKKLIYYHYSALNKAIHLQDVDSTLSYFDLEYISRIQAFRYLFAASGHGFGGNNLLVAFNPSNLKFYPFIHRDHNPYVLQIDDINDKFNGTDIALFTPLFTTLSKSDTLASLTKQYISTYISDKQLQPAEVDSILEAKSSYDYASLLRYSLNLNKKHPYSHNFETLKKVLKKDQ